MVFKQTRIERLNEIYVTRVCDAYELSIDIATCGDYEDGTFQRRLDATYKRIKALAKEIENATITSDDLPF